MGDTSKQENASTSVADRAKSLAVTFSNVDKFISMCFTYIAATDCQHDSARNEEWRHFWLRTVEHAIGIMQFHLTAKTEDD